MIRSGQTPCGESQREQKKTNGSLTQTYEDLVAEVSALTNINDDAAKENTRIERVLFQLENQVSAHPKLPFLILLLVVLVTGVILAGFWNLFMKQLEQSDPDRYGKIEGQSFGDAYWLSLTTLVAATSMDLPDGGLRVTYMCMLLAGVVAFAILVGFITESVTAYLTDLNAGRTKVAASGHTLILGWNEASLRIVLQIAILRRQYQKLNSSFMRRYLRLGRFAPSTPVAASKVVIMCDSKGKQDMEKDIQYKFDSSGISPNETRVGTDIICRVGDPCDMHSLLHVAAHRSTSILVLMTDKDDEMEEESDGTIRGGATIRCLLALRHVLASTGGLNNKNLRIVVELKRHNSHIETALFPNSQGQQIVYPLDLSVYMNSLMFSCADQPGLASLLVELLSFDGFSIRQRDAQALGLVGYTFREAQCSIQDSSLLGIASSSVSDDALCPEPDHLIGANDKLIFVSKTSLPGKIHNGKDLACAYEAEAEKLDPTSVGEEQKKMKNVLVCGWRREWEMHKQRLGQRFQGLAARLAPGSTVTFLNKLPSEKFAEIMRESMFQRKDSEKSVWDFGSEETGIEVYHFTGEALEEAVVQEVLQTRSFDIVIIMGTTANFEGKLSNRCKDVRVLMILMMLRKLSSMTQDKPIHIISENMEDATSRLALPPMPSHKHQGSKVKTCCTDFINTMGINARALVQTLAYPGTSACVEDLISDHGLKDVALLPADKFAPVDRTPPLPFGVVQALVTRYSERVLGPGRDAVCVGIMPAASEEPRYPAANTSVLLQATDRLIAVVKTRRVKLAKHDLPCEEQDTSVPL